MCSSDLGASPGVGALESKAGAGAAAVAQPQQPQQAAPARPALQVGLAAKDIVEVDDDIENEEDDFDDRKLEEET